MSEKKYYTVMFVPSDNGRTFSIRLHKSIVRSLALVIAVFVLGILYLVFQAGRIGLRLQLVEALREEKVELQQKNEELTQALVRAGETDRLASYLQRIALVVDGEASRDAAAEMFSLSDSTVEDSTTETDPAVEAGRAENQHAASVEYLASIPNIRPTEGWITRGFMDSATPGRSVHQGLDFAASRGTPIRATAPGIVQSIENHKYFGLIVALSHEFEFETRYGHCSQILVNEGDHVKRGQTIALVGNTGRSSAPHLHYEVLKGGKPEDPKKYIFTSVYLQ